MSTILAYAECERLVQKLESLTKQLLENEQDNPIPDGNGYLYIQGKTADWAERIMRASKRDERHSIIRSPKQCILCKYGQEGKLYF